MVKLLRILAIVFLLAFIGGADVKSAIVLTVAVLTFIVLFSFRR